MCHCVQRCQLLRKLEKNGRGQQLQWRRDTDEVSMMMVLIKNPFKYPHGLLCPSRFSMDRNLIGRVSLLCSHARTPIPAIPKSQHGQHSTYKHPSHTHAHARTPAHTLTHTRPHGRLHSHTHALQWHVCNSLRSTSSGPCCCYSLVPTTFCNGKNRRS